MRLLIIGASGLVGNALFNEAKNRGHETLGTYFEHPINGMQKLDYGDIVEVEKILSDFSPEAILCPAGNPNVDWIEQNPKEAWHINVEKLKALFEITSKNNLPLVFFSTDYIFDGKCGPYSEEDPPNPLNVYGKHKLESETNLKLLMPKSSLIIRSTWVFGLEPHGKNFMYSVIKNLSGRKEMKVPRDMSATPSYVIDVAKCTLDLVKKNIYGTFHLTGGKSISRFEFAKSIANVFGLSSSLLTPVNYSSMNLPVNRPLVGGLKNDKITKLTNYKWTQLEDALKEVKEKWKE